jgi:hypothetical protein
MVRLCQNIDAGQLIGNAYLGLWVRCNIAGVLGRSAGQCFSFKPVVKAD